MSNTIKHIVWKTEDNGGVMSAQAHVERIKLYGTSGSADAYVIRHFLQRSVVQFAWIELNRDEQARQKAAIDSLSDLRLPICAFPNGSRGTDLAAGC